MSGTGGTGSGGTSADCAAIAAAYDREMPNAKTCETAGGVLGTECKSAVSAKLGCGSECFTYVDDPMRLNEIAAQWTAGHCQAPNCAAVACQNPTGVKCLGAALALTGVCTDTN